MTPARARRLVRVAVTNGALLRPTTCSSCGVVPKPTSDGRARIQAHHHRGYDRPLDVQWLCAACHRAVTPLPEYPGAPTFGERNGQARLTVEEAAAIKASPLGCRKLARQYGVNKTTIQRVRNGTHWTGGQSHV